MTFQTFQLENNNTDQAFLSLIFACVISHAGSDCLRLNEDEGVGMSMASL